MVDALLHSVTTGCPWRMLPKDFPTYSTVQRFFYRWRADRLWEQINHELVIRVLEAEGRDASPTAGIIDSQSVETTETSGYAGSKLQETLAKAGRAALETVKRSDTTKGFELLRNHGPDEREVGR